MNFADPISKHFTFHEALWLPSWSRHGDVTDGLDDQVLTNLGHIFGLMDQVRDEFGAPLIVHVAWRPEKYNELVKGAKNSAHLALAGCAAVDFHVQGISCDEARKAILQRGLLDKLGLRMEDNGFGAPWVHLDSRVPIPGHPRFFKP